MKYRKFWMEKEGRMETLTLKVKKNKELEVRDERKREKRKERTVKLESEGGKKEL